MDPPQSGICGCAATPQRHPRPAKRLPEYSSRKHPSHPMSIQPPARGKLNLSPFPSHDNFMTTSADLVRGLVQGCPGSLAYFNARPRTPPLFKPRGPEASMNDQACYMGEVVPDAQCEFCDCRIARCHLLPGPSFMS